MVKLLALIGHLFPKAHATSPYQIYCDALDNYCGSGVFFGIQLMNNVVMIVFQLIGATSVIAVIVGGLKMIISGENGKEDGKKIIMYGVMGLAFAVVAVVTVRFFCQFAAAAFGEDAGAMCNIT